MDDTRERIVSVALRLFAERGYNAVGVQEICLLSEITKPTLYYHFGNKRGLLQAIALESYDRFMGALRANATYSGDLSASLVGALNVFLRFASEHPNVMRLRLALSSSPPASEEYEVMRPYSERLFEYFKEIFRSAAERHGNMRGREAAYAASFIGMADAYAGMRLSGSFEADDPIVRRVVHYFMHGIFS